MRTLLPSCAALLLAALVAPAALAHTGWHFPLQGQSLSFQNQRTPEEVGLDPAVIGALENRGIRWALWRHGYLVHVEGSFNQNEEVKSLVKTGFALTVGTALQQGRIPSYHQLLSIWRPALTGNDALASWLNALTQSTGFDYPGCGDENDYLPGEMWTYSAVNMLELNQALASVYGRASIHDNYYRVWEEAFFDSIGMSGWDTYVGGDHIRLVLDLEDMGRMGLLILARGAWGDRQLIPMWFIEQLESKQTHGMMVNYNGCNDGEVELDPTEFPEVPFGFLSWSNSAGDYYPGADPGWAFGAGADGFYLLWNHNHGIVFAGMGVNFLPTANGVPHVIEAHIVGSNPLVPTVEVNDPPRSAAPTVTFTAAPNPARESVSFRLTLAQPATMRLSVFDIAGRRVGTAREGDLAAGEHTIGFPLRDQEDRRLPAGYYRARLDVGGQVLTRGFLALD